MKKTLSLIILAFFLFSFAACELTQNNPITEALATTTAAATSATTAATTAPNDDQKTPGPLYAGYSRVSITPDFPAPLRDYNATSIADDLYVTVIALREGENTALLITADLKFAADPVLSLTFRASEEYGISEDKVIFASTHTHSAINYTGNIYTGEISDGIAQWLVLYTGAIRQAIGEALDDLDISKVSVGRAYPKGLSTTRRYFMSDGSFKSIHMKNPATKYTRHETEADNEMQVVRFTRENSKDIVLANWQAHATVAYVTTTPKAISSDFIHSFRETAEQMYGVHFAFFLGASGNIQIGSYIKSEVTYTAPADVGRVLAEYLGTALRNMTEVDTYSLATTNQKKNMEVDHSLDHLADKAFTVISAPTDTQRKRLADAYGFQSVYEAIAINTKATSGETLPFSLTVISFGDVAFIAAPYEMFDTDGKLIKELSPFEMTFVVTCANGPYLYIAPEWAYQNGGYEVYRNVFVKSTAKDLVNTFIAMLKDQHSTNISISEES